MAEPTDRDPHRIELCWAPDQNFGRVAVLPTRAPAALIVGMLRAGEPPETVAVEHGITVEQVQLLGRLADDLTEVVEPKYPGTLFLTADSSTPTGTAA